MAALFLSPCGPLEPSFTQVANTSSGLAKFAGPPMESGHLLEILQRHESLGRSLSGSVFTEPPVFRVYIPRPCTHFLIVHTVFFSHFSYSEGGRSRPESARVSILRGDTDE